MNYPELTTEFLLPFGYQHEPCPKFCGKVEDKKIVYKALIEEIHTDIQCEWRNLKCYCKETPKIRLSTTARNLHKVFLTCDGSAGSRCKYFQWIHTPLYPLPSDPMPDWLRTTNQDRSNPSLKKIESGCSKQSKMSSSGKSGNPTKPGSISLQNLPNNKSSSDRPTKV